MSDETKKKTDVKWKKEKFMAAFVIAAQQKHKTWDGYYKSMNEAYIKDTNDASGIAPHILSLRANNTVKALEKAGVKPLPVIPVRPKTETKSVADLYTQMLKDGTEAQIVG